MYKLVIDNRIVAAGGRLEMHRLRKATPGAFVGIGDHKKADIGRVWSQQAAADRLAALDPANVAAAVLTAQNGGAR